MSNADTPDYIRGRTSAQRLLGTFTNAQLVETVTLPPNCCALWLFVKPPPDTPPVTVVGVTTGLAYPVYLFPGDNYSDIQPPALAVVAPEIDSQVTITWANAPGGGWMVLADAGPRLAIDLAIAGTVAPLGTLTPGAAVLVAGTDGTDLRALKTDASGDLQTSGGGVSAALGTPGAAAPAKALQVGGSDGVDLRALLTDSTGHALTVDQTLKLAIAALGAAIPADAVLAGGSDGTDLRALLLDAAGHQLTIDQTLKLCVAVLNGALPTSAVLVAGSDTVAMRPLQTDNSGRLNVSDGLLAQTIVTLGLLAPSKAVQAGISDGTDLQALRGDTQGIAYGIPSAPGETANDHPPNELSWAALSSQTAGANVIAAPGAGKRVRLFYVHAWANDSAALYFVSANNLAGTAMIFCSNLGAAGAAVAPAVLPLTGMPCQTNTAVALGVGGGHCGCTVGYTVETV
jgi:hypothetical protein